MATITNLIPNGSFETTANWSGVTRSTAQAFFGGYSSQLGGSGTIINTVTPTAQPILNHIYYGRHYVKTNGNVTYGDARFELYAGDGAGLNFVFGYNGGNHPTWQMESNRIKLMALNGTNYIIRSFTVNASSTVWTDGLMLIDLTAGFGAGSEPTKEWCDANIPYFEGSLGVNAIGPVILSADITPNPVNVNANFVLTASVTEAFGIQSVGLWRSGETQAGLL